MKKKLFFIIIFFICFINVLYSNLGETDVIQTNNINKIIVQDVTIEYTDKNIKIIDSYKVDNEEQMKKILIDFKTNTCYTSNRNINSWLMEWKAHNRLYSLGLFKEHTKDSDFEENENYWYLLAYQILGF